MTQERVLSQIISQPTHFTENSSSLIDLLLVNDNNHVITSGVGDPFLQQDLRYHCPVFGVFNFSKLNGSRMCDRYGNMIRATMN